MKRLSRKESMAIATIHDALREFRIKGQFLHVDLFANSIIMTAYVDTEKEAKALEKTMCFFRDEKDTVKVRYIPPTNECTGFYKVELKKWMI